MNNLDLFLMGCKNLLRRKLRTFLTTLGILIGTISIVVMLSLGIAMKNSMAAQVEQMGNLNVITVSPSYNREKSSSRSRDGNLITDGDINKIKLIHGVEAVTPNMREQVKIVSGKYSTYMQLIGVDSSVIDKFDMEIDKGRMINDDDSMAIVMGGQIPYQFRDPRKRGRNEYRDYNDKNRVANVDVLNNRLLMSFDMMFGEKNIPQNGQKKSKPVNVKCTGIIKEGSWEHDYTAYIDINTLTKLKERYLREIGQKVQRNKGYDTVKVKVKDMDQVEKIQEQIKAMKFEARSMLDYTKQIDKMMNIVQMVFGGIGAISLLVAAIGITNTMIMAIYERRKEIGVMKVIGAQLKDIKRLFLLESASIGLIGGCFGLALSFLLSGGLNLIAKNSAMFEGGPPGVEQKLSVIPPWLALSALGFTTMIGLISGYLPARKAMKLSALEAIRNE